MEITLDHSLTYTNKGKVPIHEIAQSLIANEVLIKHGLELLESIYPDFKIETINVNLRQLHQESPLSEVFGISLFVGFQKSLEREVPQVIEKITGHHIPDDYRTIVTVLVFMLTYYGIETITRRVIPEKKSEKLKQNYDELISIAGIKLHIGTDVLKTFIDRISPSQARSIAKAARDFILPAQREKGAQIIGQGGVAIPTDVIDEMPGDIEFLEDEEGNEINTPYQNVKIKIRATDIDHNKTGWGGIPIGVYKDRLKMAIYPTIDLNSLYGHKTVIADIILVSKRQINGTYKPYMFHLVKIYKTIHHPIVKNDNRLKIGTTKRRIVRKK